MDGINVLLSQVLGKTAAKRLEGVSPRTLGQMQVSEITATYGLTRPAAIKLEATLALAGAMHAVRLNRGVAFRSSRDIFRHFLPLLRDSQQEEFHAVFLDSKHRVIETRMIFKGTTAACPVHPRNLFGVAVRLGASGIVIVHNHPSGDSRPSPDDIALTARLRECGELLGVQVLDHIIIGDGVYASLADRGLMYAGLAVT
jgi:DNA repair protein RadC